MANKDFVEFQKKFREYQQQFGLTGYKVYFKYEPLDHCFADITVTQADMVVTVRLNSALEEKDKPLKHIGRSAKHEAIHLLLAKLEDRAGDRYTAEKEIDEAVEELAFKLEELIK